MESGSSGTTAVLSPVAGETLWQNFTNTVPSCKGANLNHTFSCLKSASADEINAAGVLVANGSFAFLPVLDGPGGVIPA